MLNTYGQLLIGGAVLEPIIKTAEHRDVGVSAIVIGVGLALHVIAYTMTQPSAGDDDE